MCDFVIVFLISLHMHLGLYLFVSVFEVYLECQFKFDHAMALLHHVFTEVLVRLVTRLKPRASNYVVD